MSSDAIIRVIAPSSPFKREWFKKGKLMLEKLGFEVRHRKDIFTRTDYLAGSRDRRLEEFHEALDDHQASIIMAARGGYGLSQIMEDLYRHSPPSARKTFVGFSDFTLAHLLADKWKWPSVHSPMVANQAFLGMKRPQLERWKKIITGDTADIQYVFKTRSPTSKSLSLDVQGRIAGGNLRMLSDSLGTAWQIRFVEPTILFLEDIHEAGYAIDRYWTHLHNVLDMAQIQAVVWGQMEECRDYAKAFKRIFRESEVPHIFGLPIGHASRSDAIRMHRPMRLIAHNGKVTLTYV